MKRAHVMPVKTGIPQGRVAAIADRSVRATKDIGNIMLAVALLIASIPCAGNADDGLSPPVLLKTEAGESFCRIEWSPSPASGYNVYMKTGAGEYQKLNAAPITDTFARLVDLINGMPYTFAITAVGENGAESAATPTPRMIPKGYGYHTLPVKGGKGAGNYILFSSPFEHKTKSPKDMFSYLPPYRQSRWRVFSMDKNGYHEYEDMKSMEPGKGYWFISSANSELFFSGKTAQGPFAIRLQPGWNLIGSPYLFPVEWREVIRNNPHAESLLDAAVWEFANGGFGKMGTLLPFHGYLVYSAAEGDVEITIPPTPSEPKVFQEEASGGLLTMGGGTGTNWMMKLAADDGTFKDADNLFGFGAPVTATSPEPPAWPQHLSLYFTRKSETGKRFSSDLRQNVKKWTAIVEGGQNKIVRLSWKTLAGSPKAVITDIANNRKTDMAKYSSYTFTRENNAPRTFLITER
ncbi:MAG: fibronectin type III domain-containing protein [Nitrospinae bacterium]|nr:fibronectin type III domain-containing protein [Nitrospinota bacterium]